MQPAVADRWRPVFGDEDSRMVAEVEPGKLDPARFAVVAAAPAAVSGPLPYEVAAGEPVHAADWEGFRESLGEWVVDEDYPGQANDEGFDRDPRFEAWGYLELVDHDPIRFFPYTDLARADDGRWLLVRVATRPGALPR
jgi:hypothetical protein